MVDEWSGDYGCGVKYFSQDSVIKLAEYGGFKFEEGLTPAQKLKVIQGLASKDDKLALEIYENIGNRWCRIYWQPYLCGIIKS